MDDPRAAILSTAARLFARNGYDSTSLQDIARQMGLTKAGIYHYFATKQEILDSIILDLLTDMQAQVARQIPAAGSAPERLRAFIAAHVEFIVANLAEFRTVFHGRGGVATGFSESQIAVRDSYQGMLLDILRDGRDRGAFDIDDLSLQARAILGMLNWTSRWYHPDGPKSAAQIAEGYFRTIHRGIGVTAGQGASG